MESVELAIRRSAKRVELKTAIFLFIAVTTGPLGSVFLREGMKHDVIRTSFNPAILFHEFNGFVLSGDVWLGIVSRIVSGVAMLCLFSWADYSYVNPASSVSYLISVFFGWWMLGEAVPTGRWIGACLITFGVLLICMTPARTTPETAEGQRGCQERREIGAESGMSRLP
jgi:hypothetical protein